MSSAAEKRASQATYNMDASSLPEASFGGMTQAVHELTREAILDGTLEPGRQVSQLELARQLGVSRTPLREALRSLEREGLVVVRGPHRLVEISALSMSDLDELYALRIMGEAIAIRVTVPTLRDADLAMLLEQVKIMGAPKDQVQARAAHRRFHAGLRTGAGPRLITTLETLHEHGERYRRAFEVRGMATRKQLTAEHRAILRACEKGDADLAADLLVDHLASVAMPLMAAERYAPRALPLAVASAKGSAA